MCLKRFSLCAAAAAKNTELCRSWPGRNCKSRRTVTDLTGGGGRGGRSSDLCISTNTKSGRPVKSHHHPDPRRRSTCGPSIGVPDSVPQEWIPRGLSTDALNCLHRIYILAPVPGPCVCVCADVGGGGNVRGGGNDSSLGAKTPSLTVVSGSLSGNNKDSSVNIHPPSLPQRYLVMGVIS